MESKSCDGRAYCLLLCAALIFSKVQISLTEECTRTQESYCKFICSGTEIELKGIKELSAVNSKYNYTYNPCAEVKCGETTTTSPCAICQSTKIDPIATVPAGYLDNHITFLNYSSNEKSFVINYYGSNSDCTGDKPRYSKVSVQCEDVPEASLKVIDDQLECTYTFKLTAVCSITPPSPSKHSGLSIGSIIIIVFVVVLILYIVIGFLIQRFVRGAQGIDQIPNREFWVEIPILTKEGCCFVIGCCRQRATSYYEKI